MEDININFTKEAINQLILIKENDFTIGDKVFRIKIDGKGCGGFDYALGFHEKNDEDLEIKIEGTDLTFIMDPFTAHYGKNGSVNYITDFENNVEGFRFENKNEKNYRGKFFKDESKLPPS